MREYLIKFCEHLQTYGTWEFGNINEVVNEYMKRIGYKSDNFICYGCKNKIAWKHICEKCSSTGETMEDGGCYKTVDICQDCCECNDLDN